MRLLLPLYATIRCLDYQTHCISSNNHLKRLFVNGNGDKVNIAPLWVEIAKRQRTAKIETNKTISQNGLHVREQQAQDGIYVLLGCRLRNMS
jgi:hypothetical protein